MKFKSNIEVQAGIEDKDGQVGSNGQILASTGSQVDWIDPANIVTSATDVIIECKNTSGVTIAKGTPVYQTGNVGATAVIEVAVADASDEDKMAAIGLLQSDLINNAFGYVVVTGELLNITTSPIDGVTPTTGDTIYVKPGGGLTLTKPTGVNFIQNVGLVGKVSGGNAGSLTVSSIMRSNDVPTPLYIDHDNQRLGVGETSPDVKLHVAGDDTAAAFSTVLKVESTADEGSVQDIHIYNQYDRDIGIKFETLGGENYIWQDSNSDDALIFSTGGSNRTNDAALILEQDQDVIVPNGRLGVGTTSPSQKLEVDGALKVTNTFTGETSANSGYFDFSSTSSTARITTKGADASTLGKFQILQQASDGSPNATPFYIDSNSNVGIGTANPSASHKLDVNGAGRFSGNVTSTGNISARSFDMNSTYESSNQYLQLHKNQANDGGILLRSRTAAGAGQVDWQIVNQGTTGDLKFYAYGLGGNAFVLDRETGNLQLPEYGAGTLVSDASGNITVSSGGGAGGPYLPLSAGASYPLTGTLYLGNVGSDQKIQFQRTGGNVYSIEHDTAQLYFYNRTTTEIPLLIQNDGDVLINAGNVGIGTTSPSEKLEVNGNIKVDNVLLSNQQNTDVSGLELVANVLIASYTAAFFDFVIKKGTNVRSGTVYACHDGTNVEFTETSTNDLGDTSDVVLSVDISGTDMRLLADAATSGWSVKSLIRAI